MNIFNIDEEGRFGGPEKRIIMVAGKLSDYDITTTVLFPKKDSSKFKKLLFQNKIRNKELWISRLSLHFMSFITYLITFIPQLLYLARFVKYSNCELVHVNGSYQFKSALASYLSGKPFIWHLNDTRCNSIIYLLFRVFLYKLPSGYIVASERTKKYYLNGLSVKSPIFHIDSPVNIIDFSQAKKAGKLNSKYFIGVLANVNPDKDYVTLVKTISEVVKNHGDSVVFIIGGAVFDSQKKYYNYILNLLDSYNVSPTNYKFLGSVDHVSEFWSGKHIALFTSSFEASPLSVWESMAAKMPIVSTDVGSIPENITHLTNGLISPVGDYISLAENISLLIQDQNLRKNLAYEAYKYAVDNLSLEVCAKKHMLAYTEILNHEG